MKDWSSEDAMIAYHTKITMEGVKVPYKELVKVLNTPWEMLKKSINDDNDTEEVRFKYFGVFRHTKKINI